MERNISVYLMKLVMKNKLSIIAATSAGISSKILNVTIDV